MPHTSPASTRDPSSSHTQSGAGKRGQSAASQARGAILLRAKIVCSAHTGRPAPRRPVGSCPVPFGDEPAYMQYRAVSIRNGGKNDNNTDRPVT